MSQQPPADRSQLWTNSEVNTAEEARLAGIRAEEAGKQLAGAAPDDAFARSQAENNLLYQQQLQNNAAFQAERYKQNGAYIDKHNEPILAAIRAEEEMKTTKLMTGLAGGMVALAGVEATMEAMTKPAGTSPMGLTSMFAHTMGLPGGLPGSNPAPAFANGPSAMFNSRGWDAIRAFGVEPTLAVSQNATPAPGASPALAQVAPELQTRQPIAPMPHNPDFMLENSLARGPKAPSWARRGNSDPGSGTA